MLPPPVPLHASHTQSDTQRRPLPLPQAKSGLSPSLSSLLSSLVRLFGRFSAKQAQCLWLRDSSSAAAAAFPLSSREMCAV